MSIRTILTVDNNIHKSILQSKSEAYDFDNPDDDLNLILEDLRDTMDSEATCVGISANQIGILKRIFLVKFGGSVKEFINPEVIYKWGNVKSTEGCLSIPGETTTTQRAKEISIKWRTRTGQIKIRKFSGKQAIIIQHELDHHAGRLI